MSPRLPCSECQLGMTGTQTCTLFDIQIAHAGFIITDVYCLRSELYIELYFSWPQAKCKLYKVTFSLIICPQKIVVRVLHNDGLSTHKQLHSIYGFADDMFIYCGPLKMIITRFYVWLNRLLPFLFQIMGCKQGWTIPFNQVFPISSVLKREKKK